MKLSTVLISAAGVATVSAGWMPSQVKINEDLAVPGENPLFFCEDPADNVLDLKKVDLDPNPPEGGKTLSITASGTLKERVEEGAKMKVQVKYGLITLINQEMDLCDTVKKADLECPIEKGDMKLTKDVDLPKEIPPGQYTVLADVYTKNNDKITCLTAKVAFHR